MENTLNISSLCEAGLKRAGKAAFKRLDPELQQIIIDNLQSVSFGRKDEFYDHNGKYKVVIHDVEWWFLPKEARFGRMALAFSEILLALHPPSDRKEWDLAGEYWRETLKEVEFLFLCIKLLKNHASVDFVSKLTIDESLPDGQIKPHPFR
ncbi:MAG: hypothetical protein GWP19_00605 [Planctomycetia bacterium]|nr:hypothetical protein [Planctomycetia bacterium]